MKKVLLAAFAAFLSAGVFSQTILDESFDGTSIPEGWTKTSLNSTGWRFGSPSSLSSEYWVIPAHDGNCAASNDDALGQNGNSNNDRLISPSLDLTTINGPALFFDVFFDGRYGSTGSVLISTDGGTTASEFLALSASDIWQNLSISLADYSDGNDVKIIFRHSDNGEWATGVAIDNVKVFSTDSLDENVADFKEIKVPSYVDMNSDLEVKGTLKNMGANPITSMNITWNTGSQTASANIDDLNILPLETYEFTHPDLVAVDTENLTLEVTINNINGIDTAIIAHATQNTDIIALLFHPVRKVLIEQATGTWCGFCPRGHVNMDFMDNTYPNSIEVAVHNSDPMTNYTYNAGMEPRVGGYPSGMVDRTYVDIDPSLFEPAYLLSIEIQALVSVDVETTFDYATRNLTATVTAIFAGNFENANFRFNSILVEDNVSGTDAGYNQVNYYANNAFGPMGGYQNLPNPVPAASMVYRHVGRQIFGGWHGTPNSIPTTIVAGEEYSYTYSFTVPATYDEDELTVVGLVIDNDSGMIMNAEESGRVTSTEELTSLGFDFKLYPNPAVSISNIALSLEKPGKVNYMIYDLSGKQVTADYKGQLAPGEYLHTMDISNLNSGLYFVTINIDGNRLTRKLIVQ